MKIRAQKNYVYAKKIISFLLLMPPTTFYIWFNPKFMIPMVGLD